MRILVGILLVSALIGAEKSYALSCRLPSGKELIQQYDVIFQGRSSSARIIPPEDIGKNNIDSIGSKPNNITTFVIDKVYKGNISEKVEIMHSAQPQLWGRSFSIDVPVLIFANSTDYTKKLVIGICNPSFNMGFKQSPIPQRIHEILIELESYKNRTDGNR